NGYQKIIKGYEKAVKDGYEWLWIDTSCINKQSNSGPLETINLMYWWCQGIGFSLCTTPLHDLSPCISEGENRWKVRGWMLQEFMAPKQVEFFNRDWVSIGNKQDLACRLDKIMGISCQVLLGAPAPKHLCVTQVMSWATEQEMTHVEDWTYLLMGLFGVNMC
ncbi:hypothetical protein BKA82DRAFT_3982382, partial [Pisolithus tinctorius]